MMDFLVGTAYAQNAAPAQPGLMDMLLLPLGFLIIMYFLIIRPQQKKTKEHEELLKNLKAGDEVVTSGGIIGRVKSVAERFVTLEVSANTSIKVFKTNIQMMTKAPEKAK